MRYLRNSGFVAGGAVLTCVVALAVFAPWLAPHDPYRQDLAHRLVDPAWYTDGSWTHPLGTDGFGRDYLSRLLFGARISLLIGIFTMIVSGLIGTTLGVLSGYFGGLADLVVNFFVTVRLSMPVILVALAVVALIGGSLGVVILVLGFLLWDRFAVVTRSVVLQIREREYVTAAHAIGCSTLRIITRAVLPNIADQLLIIGTLEMAHAIILEASLSFLGLGVQPPLPSWGLMISDGKTFMFFKPWLIAFPGAALFLLVLAVNLLGDGIRDVTSPQRSA